MNKRPQQPRETSSLNNKIDSRPRRRWVQFSLRTLLVFTAVTGLITVFVVVPAERQRKAVKQIQAAGGTWSFDGPNLSAKNSQALADRDWTAHYRFNVVEADFVGQRLTSKEKGISSIDWSGMPRIRRLDFNCISFTKSDLEQISNLNHLEELEFSGTSQFEDLSACAKFQKLKRLLLVMIKITDPITEAVGKIPNVETIELLSCDFVQTSFHHWKNLRKLKELRIVSGFRNNNNFLELAQLHQLEVLSFFTSISKDEATAIIQLPNLKGIDLRDKGLDKGDIAKLLFPDQLETIVISDDQVEESGLENLAKIKSLKQISISSGQFGKSRLSVAPWRGTAPSQPDNGPKRFAAIIDKFKKAHPTIEIFDMPNSP